ncbi:MAG: hypothetical protein BWY82_00328 [Verrucomicrobia bacterium ADurb.Bin474]|nr:MAG: hypothetical protein BWY82_00328 [Verrucomicrobia bacterium ADurb.Bin474]
MGEFTDHGIGPSRHVSLEGVSAFEHAVEDRVGCGQGNRVAVVGASGEDGVPARMAVVPEMPCPAIDQVKVACFSGNCAEGHAASNDFAVGHKVGLNAEPMLGSARVDAEPVDHLVKDEKDPEFFGHTSQVPQEAVGLVSRPAALDRLDHDCGDLVLAFPEDFEYLIAPVVEQDHVVRQIVGNPGRQRNGVSLLLHDEDFASDSVVGSFELCDDRLTCSGAGEALGQKDGSGSGDGKRDPLGSGQKPDLAGDLTGEVRLWPKGEGPVDLGVQGLLDKIGLMSEKMDAHSKGDVDVGVSIQIPDAASF